MTTPYRAETEEKKISWKERATTQYQRYYESVFGLPGKPETKAAWLSVLLEIGENAFGIWKQLFRMLFKAFLYSMVGYGTFSLMRRLFKLLGEDFLNRIGPNPDGQITLSAFAGIIAMIGFYFVKGYLTDRYNHYQQTREVYLSMAGR
mgnify:FL=1